MADTTLIVSTSEELVDAMEVLANGEGGTILLKNIGETYNVVLRDIKVNEPSITIKSFDDNDRAVVEYLELRGRENITIDGVVFDSSGASEDRSIHAKDFMVSSSTSIAVKNSIFKGDAKGFYDGENGIEKATSMALVRETNGFIFENNDVSGYNHGLEVRETTDISIRSNEIREMQGDGLRFGGVQDLLIEDNFMHDFLGSTRDQNHMDMIQFWGTNAILNTENVIIRGNILDAGDGVATQAIFGRNEQFKDSGTYFQNILIEENVIHNGNYHGITMNNTNGLIIRNNTVLWNQDSKDYQTAGDGGESNMPRIQAEDSTNVSVYGNIASGFYFPEGVDASNNAIISYDQKGDDGYVEKQFINALVGGDGDLRDLVLNPSSSWVGKFGAETSQPLDAVDDLTAVMAVQGVSGDMNAFVFSAVFSQNETGYLNEENAQFTWTFSDGTILTGITVQKTFAEAGVKDATLVVTMLPDAESTHVKSGETLAKTDSITRDLTVQDKTLISIDFDDGYNDDSSYNSLISYTAPVSGLTTVEGVTGSGFWLDGTNKVSIDRDNLQIYDLDVFSLGIAIKQDADDDGGDILQFYKTLNGVVDENGAVIFKLTTPDGVFTVMSEENTISNDNWHKIFVTYNSLEEIFSLYVDGDLISSVTATGSTPSKAYWHLDLGDTWNDGIKGVIDDFSLTADVKTAAEIAEDYRDMGASLNRITSTGEDLLLIGDSTDNTYIIGGEDGVSEFQVKVKGFRGDDEVIVEGGTATVRTHAGRDTVILGDANDTVFGGKQADVLHGGGGDDLLNGNNGKDELYGGQGDDTLIGSGGHDIMTGGAGSDVFVFNWRRDEGNDIITDFDVENDLIRISKGGDFSDLMIDDFGRGTTVLLSNGTQIILQNVDASAIDVDNFEFI
ncbi:LamG-like jellyroll fold domain-containing protein [Roseobacter sp. N2S]|uniref:LamG-like jellyroll fold domain-containing protein n=1 Tax=Roseobacter sp. N2S TaxID=2663844 RepID=UPI00285C66BF|nr:LamG-like jellyroll fold domain-containing protein [Roseobacter sp. N2S]MDR6267672.1 Ca2+-binding RTX toxin-like protein [Roseobacter sp. N2S]